jgi:hypothetical protein
MAAAPAAETRAAGDEQGALGAGRKSGGAKSLTPALMSGIILFASSNMRRLRKVYVEPWCSGLTCLPVTQKIAGSNPVGSVATSVLSQAGHWSLHTQQLPLTSVILVKKQVAVS